jgi:hypothetical protein
LETGMTDASSVTAAATAHRRNRPRGEAALVMKVPPE